MGSKTKIFYLWSPVFLAMAAIFYFSALPGQDIPAVFCGQDIIFHAGIYGILAFFLIRALKNTYTRITPFRRGILAVLFCFAYGISDEFHQSFVPNRDPALFDVGVDVFGAIFTTIIYR